VHCRRYSLLDMLSLRCSFSLHLDVPFVAETVVVVVVVVESALA